MMKEGLNYISHKDQHVYQHSKNNLSGDQSLQVLNYRLVTSIRTKWNLSIGIPAPPKEFPTQVDTWTTFDHIIQIYVEPAVLQHAQQGHHILLHTLHKGMILTHFHAQVQLGQLHSNAGNQHEVQPHSTKSMPTVELSHPLKNFEQLQYSLPLCIAHILIIYLHWCFRHQGDILSTNPTLQVAPVIGLDEYLGVATCTYR